MRTLTLCLLLVSCTPTPESVERHDPSMTDSALSVLSTIGRDTVVVRDLLIARTDTVVIKEFFPVMVFDDDYPMEEEAVESLPERTDTVCDTVWVRDTVWLSR